MWQILGILFIAGLVLHYFWWIVGLGLVVGVTWLVRDMMKATEQAAAREAARQAAIAARADQEHAWILQGDPRGVYSEGAMPTIRRYERAVSK